MSTIKEIAIFDTHAPTEYPEELLEEIKGKSFIEIRAKILPSYLKSFPSVSEDEFVSRIRNLAQGSVIRYKDSLHYINSNCEVTQSIPTYRLVEVDTSLPWTVLGYDGAEYVEYLTFLPEGTEFNYHET